ncbi:hypothetical protein FQN52_007169 [Onygenales sp. PD_12]|nr:hypothetical protein FQN51_004085 [Onygenales sp. PD_10]KAK2785630.1 hypothetical protein FQN53_007563 [Emmonsiellopsis sp. PD_33]KAK2787678.1 hypothetical protein FQN52_007169 [Onygenales sp. PD_12]
MNNAPPPPGPGAGAPSFSSIPRRSSYASVVSGTAAAASALNSTQPGWSGPPGTANNSTPTPSSSYPPQHRQPDSRLYRASWLDHDMQTNGGVGLGGPAGAGGAASSGGPGWRRAAPSHLPSMPAYSRQFANSPDSLGFLHGLPSSSIPAPPPFFTPSYLKHSRYISQLAASHRSKALAAANGGPPSSSSATAAAASSSAAAQKDSSSNHSSTAPSLSASSSNANLHRLAPSHRGMTHEIIEHPPPTADEEEIMPLPSRWSQKYPGLDLIDNGLEVRYLGPANKGEHDAAAARADHPIPPQCGIYYYEITILAKPKDGMIGVGFGSNKASLERLPGWDNESWAYHGDDGKTFFGDSQGQGKTYGPTFTVNDTIGCGINFATGSAFFTKNGIHLGNAFRELRNVKLYPSVGVKKYPGAHLRANFGQFPFIYDIDGMMAKEKLGVQADISTTSISNLHPSLDETAFIQELVAQFLAHGGYVETVRAFTEEVQEESRALRARDGSGRETPLKDYLTGEDGDAANRQKIRAAILDGDIDKALKLTNTSYANVLRDNPQIHFRLRCRKFIEMMRRFADLQESKRRNKMTNGAKTAAAAASAAESSSAIHDDVFTHDMELDDEQMNDIDSEEGVSAHEGQQDGEGDGMDVEEAEAETDYGLDNHDLMKEAILYGQQLQADFPGDQNREYQKTLDDVFSLICYDYPMTSVHGHLLEPSGRVPVAEELNKAILVSLGKSSTTALERLYQQAEVLVDEISEDGGAGAFVNVQADYFC